MMMVKDREELRGLVKNLLVGRVNQLLNVERWHPFYKVFSERVWGHQSQLSFIVWWLLYLSDAAQYLSEKDWWFLFTSLVLHDTDEIYGDVPANFKQNLSSELAQKGNEVFFKETGLPPFSLSPLTPKQKVLGLVIEIADALCTASFILKELTAGNRFFLRMAGEMTSGEVKGLLNLLKKVKEAEWPEEMSSLRSLLEDVITITYSLLLDFFS
mgnify:CR=1 FL=1